MPWPACRRQLRGRKERIEVNDRIDAGDVERLAGMARGQQRDLAVVEAEAAGPVVAQQRQRLERLQGGTGERQAVGIAGGMQQATVAVDDRDRSVVDVLDRVAARGDDQGDMGWDGHAVILSERAAGLAGRGVRGPPATGGFASA
jgi:hypothetical protein